ncbi:MAG: hypothetical protein DWQ19_09920 [Crenarchaeota archaeon]|nr:MAG: hypothetical protein DWQ19_09920 [Thermoproteota archaeon]
MNFREFFEKKAWKAKKADVIQFWQNIKPNLPIQMEPVSATHKGTRFRSDGIRITGSPQFINSVLSRIKDIIQLQSGDVRLDVEYREIENKEGDTTPSTQEYVFYVHLVDKNNDFVPKIPKPKKL